LEQPQGALTSGDRLMADRLLAAIEQLNESIVLTDAEDRFVLANRAFRELNRNVAHAIQPGQKFEDYMRAGLAAGNYPDAVGREQEWLAARLAERRNPGAPVERQRPGGRCFLIDDRRLPDGSMIRFGTEITDRKRAEAVLNERSRDLQLIVNSVPEMITRLDRDERFLFANRAYTELMERPAEDIIGRRIAEVVAPEVYAQIKPALDRALSGDPVSLERIQRRSNGEQVEIEGRYIPCIDAGGRVIGLIAVHRDVTAQRQADRSLAKSEARFRSLTALSSDWFWEQDENFRNVHVSDDVETRGGMAKSSRLGKARWELPYTGITEQQWAEHRAQLERHESFRDFQYGRVDGEGNTVWFSVSGEPVFDARGGFAGYRGVASNISERKRAEQALAASEARFRAIFERSSAGMAISDASGTYLSVNAAFARFFGCAAEDIVGKLKVSDLRYADDAEGAVLYQRLVSGEIGFFERDRPYQRKDGAQIWGRSTVSAVRDAGGKAPYVVAVFSDITEEVLARARIERMNAELEERVESRTAELREAMKELDAFTYSVSHDLRAPIGAVSGFAHLLRSAEAARLSEDGRRLLDFIEHNAERMTRLIEGLLRFSRLGRSDLRRTRVSMNMIAGESLLDFVDEVARARINAGAMPDCEGDPTLLNQVWSNLVGNALKYSRDAKPPCIDIGWDANRNAYYVRDNGVGFDMAYAGKLFGVFERLHAESEFEGSGIGLAIAERIVRLHGGAIWADAAPGRGATFWFTVPANGKGAAPELRSSPDTPR
jgi:PAS domain S-box-containing protein